MLFTLLPLGGRASIIVMVAIPLSLALGIVGLNIFGFSLNQLTIVGLVVALGLLVDDSIVVVENIERWLRDGYSKKEAAIKATQQITLAVIGCTAMLAISFLPMLFLPAGPGEFIRGLPMAVICSVLASMIVSLTVVPFLASRVLKSHVNPDGNLFLRALKKAISSTYSRLMHRALHRPVLTLLIAFGLFGASAVLFPIIGFKLFPTSEKAIFMVNVRMPQQTSLSDGDRITRMIEDSLSKSRLVKYYTSNIGKGNPQIYYNVPQQPEKSDFAQIFVQLNEDTRPLAKTHLIDTLRARFASFPYARVEVKDFEQGPPIDAPIAIRIFGDNLDTLRKISFQVGRIIEADKGTVYVDNDLNTLKTDIKVNINRDKARTLGVFTADIDRTLRLAIAGLKIGTFTNETSNGDDYDVIVSATHDKFAMLDVFKKSFCE